MVERKFDRLRSFNELSRNYSIGKLTRNLEAVTTKWDCDKILDQGSDGSCVGHGIAHELIAKPVPCLQVDHKYAVYIYDEAKKVDEWPGEDYEGTSVIAGLKVAKKLGWYDSYQWAFNLDDMLVGVSNAGPAVMGTNWYTGMMTPDSNGFIKPTGYNEGGHCWLLAGVDVEHKFAWCVNSWGKSWGLNGWFKLTWDDLWYLMEHQGECAFVLGRHDIGEIPEPEPDPDNGCFLAKWFTRSVNSGLWVMQSRYRIQARKEV